MLLSHPLQREEVRGECGLSNSLGFTHQLKPIIGRFPLQLFEI